MSSTFRLGIKEKATSLIAKFTFELSILLFIVGIGMIISWPFQAKKTYFSENAISFGTADDTFQFHPNLSKHPLETIQSLGLEVIEHNNTFFAKLRAPKGNGKESLLIISNDLDLSLNIIKYLSQQKWLHHDLLFMIENEKSNQLEEILNSRKISTGVIREAIYLNFDHYQFESVVLNTVGKNGDLPNLDLVNIIIYGCEHSLGIKVDLYDQSLFSIHPSYNVFFHHYKQQLFGNPTNFGKDGFLSKFNTHTITLTAPLKKSPNVNIYRNKMLVGKLTTSTIRYLNNLIESMHQSYFLYFMMSNYSFMGYEEFLLSVLLIVFAFAAQFIYYFSKKENNDCLLNSIQNVGLIVLFSFIVQSFPYLSIGLLFWQWNMKDWKNTKSFLIYYNFLGLASLLTWNTAIYIASSIYLFIILFFTTKNYQSLKWIQFLVVFCLSPLTFIHLTNHLFYQIISILWIPTWMISLKIIMQ
eukprot:gene3422-5967_t